MIIPWRWRAAWINAYRRLLIRLSWLASLVYRRPPLIYVYEGRQQLAAWRGDVLAVGDTFEVGDASYRRYRIISRRAFYRPADTAQARPALVHWRLEVEKI